MTDGNWLDEAAFRLKRRRKLLFSAESDFLAPLLALLNTSERRNVTVWALECARAPVLRLGEIAPDDGRPAETLRLARLWAGGEVKMPPARRAILGVLSAARDMPSTEGEALCHAVGQACSVVHTPRHAAGLPVYELTAIVRRFGLDGCRGAVETRMAEYLDCLARADAIAKNPEPRWARFLE